MARTPSSALKHDYGRRQRYTLVALGWRGGPPLRLCFLQRWEPWTHAAPGFLLIFAGFPLKYKTWLASAESINPKRDRLVESHLSKNERWATRLSKNERWANRLIGKAAHAQSLHLRGTDARLRGRRPTVSDEGEPQRMAPKLEWDGRQWP